MSFLPGTPASRREFFRAGARYSLLGLLGAVSGLTAWTRRSGQRCVNRGLCGPCPAFAQCGLPAAKAAKAAK
jgi:hypothetical protein